MEKEKYRKVQKPKETSPPDEIRVTGVGHVCNYVTYTAKLFNEMQHNSVTIRATGKAVSIAVSVAEVVKRRFRGLHQVTTIGCTRLMNEYEPIEEGLDKIEETRTVSFISIHLARDGDAEKVDTNAPGYQPPLDDSLVRELDPSTVSRQARPHGQGRRGRGRGGFNRGNAANSGNRGRVGNKGLRRCGSPGGSPGRRGGHDGSSGMQQHPHPHNNPHHTGMMAGNAMPPHSSYMGGGDNNGGPPMYGDYGYDAPRSQSHSGRGRVRRMRGGPDSGEFRGGYRGGRGSYRGRAGPGGGGRGGPRDNVAPRGRTRNNPMRVPGDVVCSHRGGGGDRQC